MGTNLILHCMQKAMFGYNFDSGVNFWGQNFCGKFFTRELFIADRKKIRKNRKQLQPAKI